MIIKQQDALKKAYTGLPVVRVTQKQKVLSELGCIELQPGGVSVNFFKWGVIKTI